MSIAHLTTYEQDAVDLVGSKLSEIPELVALLHAYAGASQASEDDAWSVITEALFDIVENVGVQLDRVGAIIGQPRWSREDGDYRNLLNARILANNSKGTPEDLISVLLKLFDGIIVSVEYQRFGVASAGLSVNVTELIDPDAEVDAQSFVTDSKPVGTNILLLAQTVTAITPQFIFGSTGDGWGVMALNTQSMQNE